LKEKIVIGLSGGVDSSVAAFLLKEQGYEVIAVYMINWKDTTGTLSGACPYEEDVLIAELVARKLDIAFHVVDLSDTYRHQVVDYMFEEYAQGRTPNPDVLCNREIKFDAFLQAAQKFGASKIATGHYCRSDSISKDGGRVYYRLLAGRDKSKDQSYFLCQLSQEQLSQAVFPIGELNKGRVRELAGELGLASAQKRDSQGICFVGKVDLPVFLQQKLSSKKGPILEIPSDFKAYRRSYPDDLEAKIKKQARPYQYRASDAVVLGEHQGAHFYTVGQRKGLHVGGTEKPLYVLATDVENNCVYVGRGEDHPGLYRKALKIQHQEVHWIRPDMALKPGESAGYSVRIRYRQALQPAILYCFDDALYIAFEEKQRSIMAGQFAVWYRGDELVGSGVISS
jgi:tRNA-specific 2-thiouridylase